MDSVTATVTIRYDDETYQVPARRTVLAALEWAGVRFVRGVGCRGGVCGACTFLYRLRGEYELKAGLLCQELVREAMEILPLPTFPQKKQTHRLTPEAGENPAYQVLTLYPEVNRCIMCGECTRICPMHIDVMGFVGMIKRGELKAAAAESFTCIQCQACVARCPAQISQPNAALAARRLYGRFQLPLADHLDRTLARMESPEWKRAFRRLRRLDAEALQIHYQRREREPDDAPPGTWLPEDRSLIA